MGADAEILGRMLEWCMHKHAQAQIIYVFFKIWSHKAAKNDITVCTHADIADYNCQMFKIVVKKSTHAFVLIVTNGMKKTVKIAICIIRKVLGAAVCIQTAIPAAITAFSIGDNSHMSKFCTAIVIAYIELIVQYYGSTDTVT